MDDQSFLINEPQLVYRCRKNGAKARDSQDVAVLSLNDGGGYETILSTG